jgi:hypothetical protein
MQIFWLLAFSWSTMSETVLNVYLAPSGQWSGVILEDGDEVARIAGCSSPGEVEEQAYEQFPIDRVEAE